MKTFKITLIKKKKNSMSKMTIITQNKIMIIMKIKIIMKK